MERTKRYGITNGVHYTHVDDYINVDLYPLFNQKVEEQSKYTIHNLTESQFYVLTKNLIKEKLSKYIIKEDETGEEYILTSQIANKRKMMSILKLIKDLSM